MGWMDGRNENKSLIVLIEKGKKCRNTRNKNHENSKMNIHAEEQAVHPKCTREKWLFRFH